MKRRLMVTVICLLMMVPSVCMASSEVRLSADDGGWRAEVWHDGALFLRFVLTEAMAVWQSEGDDKTLRACPIVKGGMLRLIIR
jgi:hypothetical protein